MFISLFISSKKSLDFCYIFPKPYPLRYLDAFALSSQTHGKPSLKCHSPDEPKPETE
ncbi:hypothetical protein V6Z11_A08G188000 [Gossypium hirsutum]